MTVEYLQAGSKEETSTGHYSQQIYTTISSLSSLTDNVLIDDRLHMTIGKRLFDARRFGYPFIIAVGSAATQNPPLFELHDLTNSTKYNFTQEKLFNYMKSKLE